MNNKIILGIIGVIIIAGIVVVMSKRGNSPQIATKEGVYCSSDGTLSNTISIQSHRSYCLKADSSGKTYGVNSPNEYSFSIVDDQGKTLKDFSITHTKMMHVIVARKDLAYFQHVHPEFDASTGIFTFKDLTFSADGEYRIFADFAATGSQMDAMSMPLTTTLSEDVPVGNLANYKPQAIGTEEKTKTFDGLQVTLNTHGTPTSGAESMLMFSLSQNGKPVTDLESYLGALGHAVVLREGNLDFIHAHPSEDVNAKQTGNVDFMVDFPEAGKYKVFTQFQRAGKVITTDFVVTVTQGATSPDSMQGMDMQSMPGMDHSKMQMGQ
ncbi:MAG: hypothetical protein ACYC6X_01155 [Minisyncoccota bacterium]